MNNREKFTKKTKEQKDNEKEKGEFLSKIKDIEDKMQYYTERLKEIKYRMLSNPSEEEKENLKLQFKILEKQIGRLKEEELRSLGK